MVELKRSTIYAIGATQNYEDLFKRLNSEFTSNSINKLIFEKSSTETSAYTLKIETKYYDLLMDLVIVEFEQCTVRLAENYFEGLLLLLGNEYPSTSVCDFIFKKFEENPASFKAVIQDKAVLNDQEVSKKFKEVEDLIQIDLSNMGDNDEGFGDLEEFINSIFVHPWSEMELKSASEKPVRGSLVEMNSEAGNTAASATAREEPDEEAFNFEDMLMNLGDYKAKADGLEFEDRKKFAEDIVRKFWKSIGGDAEELDDLN